MLGRGGLVIWQSGLGRQLRSNRAELAASQRVEEIALQDDALALSANEALAGEVFGAGAHGFPNPAAEPAHRERHWLTLHQPMIEPSGARRSDLPGKVDVRSVRQHQRRPPVIGAADGSGIPAPKIDYTLSANSLAMMNHGIARANEILDADAGATGIGVESPILNGGWHLLGTARMGIDPAKSVVNEWGRCHDVKNLFIVDGSIWVTSGGVNPTSTIQALALYIADTIKQRLAILFD